MIPLLSHGLEQALTILLWVIAISVGLGIVINIIVWTVMFFLVLFGLKESKPKNRRLR